MNIEQLRYIVEVIEIGSITGASKKLHVSQPNISQSISKLEQELNVKLFERSRMGAKPTAVGILFVEKAKFILQQIEELTHIAQIENNTLSGSISLIVIPIISLTILPPMLSPFKMKYPDVQIEVSEDGSQHAIDSVLSGKADIGIITLRNDMTCDPKLNFEPLLTSKTIAYVSKNSPLAIREEITLKEIVEYPLVLFNERYSTSNHLRHLLQQYGTPNILFSSSNSDAMRKVIAESLAIGFYSDISLKTDIYIQNKEIIPVRIKDETFKYSTYGIITKSESFPSVLKLKIIEELKIQAEHFKQLYDLPDYSKM